MLRLTACFSVRVFHIKQHYKIKIKHYPLFEQGEYFMMNHRKLHIVKINI